MNNPWYTDYEHEIGGLLPLLRQDSGDRQEAGRMKMGWDREMTAGRTLTCIPVGTLPVHGVDAVASCITVPPCVVGCFVKLTVYALQKPPKLQYMHVAYKLCHQRCV